MFQYLLEAKHYQQIHLEIDLHQNMPKTTCRHHKLIVQIQHTYPMKHHYEDNKLNQSLKLNMKMRHRLAKDLGLLSDNRVFFQLTYLLIMVVYNNLSRKKYMT